MLPVSEKTRQFPCEMPRPISSPKTVVIEVEECNVPNNKITKKKKKKKQIFYEIKQK